MFTLANSGFKWPQQTKNSKPPSIWLGRVRRETRFKNAKLTNVAGVAQSVEQLIRNEKVGCSIHLSGTNIDMGSLL